MGGAAGGDGPPGFEHHGGLPRVDLATGSATVLVGRFLGAVSPARRDTDHVGVELDLRAGAVDLPLPSGFEHGLVVLDGTVRVEGQRIEPGRLGYLGPGRDALTLEAAGPARVLLFGGSPFPEPLVMWWNYVARGRDEITQAHADWLRADARFGTVASSLDRIEVPGPPWAAPT